jgi:hypothetical protein
MMMNDMNSALPQQWVHFVEHPVQHLNAILQRPAQVDARNLVGQLWML